MYQARARIEEQFLRQAMAQFYERGHSEEGRRASLDVNKIEDVMVLCPQKDCNQCEMNEKLFAPHKFASQISSSSKSPDSSSRMSVVDHLRSSIATTQPTTPNNELSTAERDEKCGVGELCCIDMSRIEGNEGYQAQIPHVGLLTISIDDTSAPSGTRIYTEPVLTVDGRTMLVTSAMLSDCCAICLSEFEPHSTIKRLKCHHYFHSQSCLVPWFKKSNQCPVCRAVVNTDEPN